MLFPEFITNALARAGIDPGISTENLESKDNSQEDEAFAITDEQLRQETRAARQRCMVSAAADIHCLPILSPLDSRAPTPSLRGFYNLGAILLFVSYARLVVENAMKYGLLLSLPPLNMAEWPKTWPCLSMTVTLIFAAPFAAFSVERAADNGRIGDAACVALHVLITAATLVLPIVVIEMSNAPFLSGLLAEFVSCILFLKLVSYAHVMHTVRKGLPSPAESASAAVATPQRPGLRQRKSTGKVAASKPRDDDAEIVGYEGGAQDNPHTFSHLFYFLLAPTLCYQASYPRWPSQVRYSFLVRRLVEMAFCVVLIVVIAQQWTKPILDNAITWYMQQGQFNYFGILERMLKLSVPNLAIWVLLFFAFFHSFLNATAELLRFADRQFYKDWWNARTLKDYWNSWNMPVHNFVLRHVYAPLLRAGCSTLQAQIAVFFVSAALHELLFSVPAHTVRFWAFAGMMSQIPLIILTETLYSYLPRNSPWGNAIFWVSFCIFGQPLGVLMYYYEIVQGS